MAFCLFWKLVPVDLPKVEVGKGMIGLILISDSNSVTALSNFFWAA